MAKEIKNLNDSRVKLMSLYDVTPEAELANKEILTLGNINELEDYVYKNLIKKGKTALEVIRGLKENNNISTMAAAHLCQLATQAVFESVDTRTEFCLSLNEAKEKIGQLNEMLEQVLLEGENSEGNPEAIITEIREWTKIKNDLIKVGTQTNLLASAINNNVGGTNNKKVRDLKNLSLEELEKKLNGGENV